LLRARIRGEKREAGPKSRTLERRTFFDRDCKRKNQRLNRENLKDQQVWELLKGRAPEKGWGSRGASSKDKGKNQDGGSESKQMGKRILSHR